VPRVAWRFGWCLVGKQLALDLRESPIKLVCDYCGLALVPRGCTTGGGVNAAGETLCYDCCGFADVIDMANTEPGQRGVIALYAGVPYLGKPTEVSNWPSSLTLTVTSATEWKLGGFGSKRRTVYFRGPMGSHWSGVEFNGNAGTFLRNVRRLKS
jgi:hypothetical protein